MAQGFRAELLRRAGTTQPHHLEASRTPDPLSPMVVAGAALLVAAPPEAPAIDQAGITLTFSAWALEYLIQETSIL